MILNVLILTQFFSTTKGGGEYLFKIITKVLTENGHKVWVVTNNVKGETYQESENLKIITVKPTLEYKGGLPPTFLDNIRYVFNSFRIGKKIIKNENIDIVHSNNFSPALSGSMISYFTKTPHIITIFDIFSQNGKEFWQKWIKQTDVSKINAMLVPWFEKLLLKVRHDGIYTISNRSKKDIENLDPSKPIYNIPPTIKEENVLDEVKNPLQFVCIGRLVFYKNIEVVIKAIKIVSEEFPDVKLIIIGNGPHKKSLESLIEKLELSKNIRLEGFVTSEQKKKLLSSSTAMLFPSLIEGFGLVILEAFQQKKPVLVSDIEPMSEIIEHEKTGIVINPHDEKEWAKHMINMIENPRIVLEMGEMCKKTLNEKYNQKIFYKKIFEMYKTCNRKQSE